VGGGGEGGGMRRGRRCRGLVLVLAISIGRRQPQKWV